MKSNRPFSKSPVAIAIGAILAGGSSQALAQSDETEERGLEEIIVTATRRETSVQDVPYNISAISGKALERALITDQADLMRVIPGVAVVDRGYRNSGVINGIMIRGVNVDGSAFGDYALSTVPTVSTYVNETPLYANFVLRDIERVEVLRGPQGTLYGSGSLGGTVRYIMRDPDPSAFGGQVNLIASQVDGSEGTGWSGDVTLNAPLGETAAVRLNIGRMDYPGVTDYVNVYVLDANGAPVAPNGVLDPATEYRVVEDADTVEINYGRLSFLWEPNDRFRLLAAYQAQEDAIGGRRQESFNTDGFGRSYQDYENGSIQLEPSSRDVDMSSLEMEFDLGFATLTSSTSVYDHSGESVSENTGFYAQAGFLAFYYNFPRPMASAVRTYENSAVVQELRLTSNTEGKVDYVVGAFYMDQDLSSTQQSFLPGFKAWWDVWSGAPGAVTGDQDFNYDREETFKDLGLFGEVTWHFTDALHGTVGMRYFDNEFSNTTLIDLPLYTGLFQPGTSSFEIAEDDVLFKANLAYDVSDNVMVYGTVSEGYRRGGSNAVPTTGNYAENPGYLNYESDTVLNMEVGVKWSTDQMRIAASLFQVNWDNVQVNTATPTWGFFAAINGDRATTKGVELELDGYVNEFFEYRLGYAFVNAELDDPIIPPGSTTPSSLAGATLPGTPEHTVNAEAIFTTEVGQAQWINRLSAYYQTPTRNAANTSTFFNVELEAFNLWDASTTLAWEKWDATLFIRNISNEKGVTGLFTEAYMGTAPTLGYYGNGNKQFLSLPRTLGLSVNYRF